MNGVASTGGGGVSSVDDQPGATDNRLSLSIGDHPEIKDWQDGKTYRLELVVEQQATGEFNVVSAQGEEAEPGEGNQSPTPDAEAQETGSDYPNPAVARMAGGPRA